MNRKFKLYLEHLVEYIMTKAFSDEADGGLNMTEEQLAHAAELHPSTVYKLRTSIEKYRTRDPRLRTLYKLCLAVGIEWSVVTAEMGEVLAGHAD